MTSEEFKSLPLKERIILTAGSKIIEHFRGLELAGMINKESAKNLIGCVRKLQSIARGEEQFEKTTNGTQP